MRLLGFLVVLWMSAMPGVAGAQVRQGSCPQVGCPQVKCFQKLRIRRSPRRPAAPLATCCSPQFVSVCNSTIVHSYSGSAQSSCSTYSARPIVYGPSPTVIRPGSIPVCGVYVVPHYGHLPGAAVYSNPVPSQGLPNASCICGAVPKVIPEVSAAAVAPPATATPHKPFELSGQVRPDSGRAVPNPCEIDFLACCAAGGRNCFEMYVACTGVSGESMRHLLCPQVAPTIDE